MILVLLLSLTLGSPPGSNRGPSVSDATLDAVVSMLDDNEAEDLGLTHQAQVCAATGIELIRCPVGDHGVPDEFDAFVTALDRALAHLDRGGEVAAHCFAGIGRSPLFVTAVLVRRGIAHDEAWRRVSSARGMKVPDTRKQSQWIADRVGLLRRGK